MSVLALELLFRPLEAGLGSPPPAPSPANSISSRYSNLVFEFRDGNAADAVRELASWDPQEVRRAVKVVADLLGSSVGVQPLVELATPETRRRAAENEARFGAGAGQLLYLKSATGLHAAIAAAAWRRGQDALVLEHVGLVETYFQDRLAERDPEYAEASCRIGGMLLTGSVHFSAALQHYERCLKWRPRDAWLLLGHGATLEAAAMSMAGLDDAALVDWPGPKDTETLLKDAAADYDAALKQAPDLDEARIRLARLQLQRDDLDDAARNLSQALDDRLPRVLAYWAHLFLGATDERAGTLNDATGHYRAALALYPEAQAAGIALAHVLAQRLGAPEDALAALHTRIAPSANRQFDSDPWWLYPGGQAWRAPEWLGDFERRSRQ